MSKLLIIRNNNATINYKDLDDPENKKEEKDFSKNSLLIRKKRIILDYRDIIL